MRNKIDCKKQNSGVRATVKSFLFGVGALLLILALWLPMSVGAEEQIVTVETPPVVKDPDLFLTRSMPTVGEGRIAVFLIEFPDYKNENPLATVEHYEKAYFTGGVTSNWGSDISVSEFFAQQSGGRLRLDGRVFDWYTAKHERSYYDDKKSELIMEVAEYYVARGVDFSEFDGDGDGVIDSIIFHFTGEFSNDSSGSWYHGQEYGNPGGLGTVDGLKFNTIIQVNEMAKTGQSIIVPTACHELMHVMGMPDLYGTAVLGMTVVGDLMSANAPVIHPYFKILLGWVDQVRVVTEAKDDIRLDIDEFVIVTDEFNGFYDEFYIVSYPWSLISEKASPVVVHVDARLTSDGRAFLNDNYNYDPRPDKSAGHEAENDSSPNLFMEQLSFDPSFDYVLNNNYISDKVRPGEHSVLGPNSVPSSVWHDGAYSGIRMERFLEHADGTYMTFDLSFVEDAQGPICTNTEDQLHFSEIVTLSFNEFIQKGAAWDQIAVTDLNGNALNAAVLLPRYPHHQIEISFRDEGYRDGYRIVLPEGCVRDAVGNGNQEKTLSLSPNDFFHPVAETQLPGVSGWGDKNYQRFNLGTYFFPCEEGTLVAATLGSAATVGQCAIELMLLDHDGNVLRRNLAVNPFTDCSIDRIEEAGDGSLVVFCTAPGTSAVDLMFGVDRDGTIRWSNRSYLDTTTIFINRGFKCGEGLVFHVLTQESGEHERYDAYLDPNTGTLTRWTEITYEGMFNLSGNRLLRTTPRQSMTGQITRWEILNGETYESLAYIDMVGEPLTNDYNVRSVKSHEDGTLTVFCTTGGSDDLEAFVLDAELNVIQRKVVGQATLYEIQLLDDDGFCIVNEVGIYDHDDSLYRVYRYDRNLNLMWTEDVTANFIRYFKNSSGGIFAYKSMFSPIRECYIVSYSDENGYKTTHEHTVKHVEARLATCVKNGFGEFWHCPTCGVRYSDAEGSSVITDIKPHLTPATGHSEEIIPYKPNSCTTAGNTEGSKCSVCQEILKAPREIPKWSDHIYSNWKITKTATCSQTGEKSRYCFGDCGITETETIPLDREQHIDWSGWTMVIAPDCKNEGLSKRVCRCGLEEELVLPVDDKKHSYGYWETVKEPTCAEEGWKHKVCAVCEAEEIIIIPAETKTHTFLTEYTVTLKATCNTSGRKSRVCECGQKTDIEIIPATGKHSFGEWSVEQSATCVSSGREARRCSCGEREIRDYSLPAGAHSFSEWTVIQAASCAAEGEETRICHCGQKSEQRTIPANNDHDLSKWECEQTPTCGKVGKETRECACGKVREERDIPVVDDHILGTWETREPTCTEDGVRTRSCDCGKNTETEVLPVKDGHSFDRWEATGEIIDGKRTERRICFKCKTEEIRTVSVALQDTVIVQKPQSDPSAGAQKESGGVPPVVLAVGGGVIVLLGAALLLAVLKRKK